MEIRATPNSSFFVDILKIEPLGQCLISASNRLELNPFSVWKFVYNLKMFVWAGRTFTVNISHLFSCNRRENFVKFLKLLVLWSISPTLYEKICANILVPEKVQTWNVSTKKVQTKLSYKLLYKKGVRKILVKWTLVYMYYEFNCMSECTAVGKLPQLRSS